MGLFKLIMVASLLVSLAGSRLTSEHLGSKAEPAIGESPSKDAAPKRLVPQAAIDLAIRGDYERALPYYREAVTSDPTNAEKHAALGVILMAMGRYKDAKPVLESGIELEPANGEYQCNLALCLGFSGRLEESLKTFEKAAQLAPDNPKPWFEKGKVLYLHGDLNGAIAAFSRSLEIQEAPEVLFMRAALRRRNRDFNKAIVDCDRVLELAPNARVDNARACRGFSLAVSGELQSATKDAEHLIATNGDLASTGYLIRGIVRFVDDENVLAIADFTKAIELDSADPLPRVLRAVARRQPAERSPPSGKLRLLSPDELSECKADLDAAIKVAGTPEQLNVQLEGFGWQVYKFRGLIQSLHGDDKKVALEDFNQAIRMNPKDGECFALRGLHYMTMSKWELALADLKQSRSISRDEYLANVLLSRWYTCCPELDLRNGDRALQLAKAACENNDNDPAALQSVALAYAELGDFETAISTQKKVVSLMKGPDANRIGHHVTVWWSSTSILHLTTTSISSQLLEQFEKKHWRPKTPTEGR